MDLKEMATLLRFTSMILPLGSPKDISVELCNSWGGLLKEYAEPDIKSAFGIAVKTLTQFPTPSIIIRLIQGSHLSDQEVGSDIASRIWKAIGQHGAGNLDRAKKDLGELGWEVVRQCGGWVSICDTTYDLQASAMKMWRETASVISKNFHFNGQNLPPSLPQGRSHTLNQALKLALGEEDGKNRV